MRKFIKQQLFDLLDSIDTLHNVLFQITDKMQIVNILADCQDAAIAIGNALERDSDDHKIIVELLEDYCEMAFYVSQEEFISIEKLSSLTECTKKIKNLILNIAPSYHVVFMPYKASMWDSLESIWRVCMEDKHCESFVIPIPYYEYDSNSNSWKYCYDGNLFPKEISIVSYQSYLLEQNYPDIIYIHNPYDDCNMVTRLDPRFYSRELKRYTSKLVYVPYYVTTGFISPEHLELPVYKNMDYMVVQSNYAKSFFEGLNYYNKILPFGSPKLDKVVRLSQNENNRDALSNQRGKKTKKVMLNTSIGCFLQDGSLYLEKIRNLCKTIKNYNQVEILWRPHPLLEATIKSMRPHLLSEYKELKAYFLENKIGELDESPDISNTVAISNGYIGEEGSSVINLFGAAGKPIFILNNNIINIFSEEEKRRVHFTDIVINEDKIWLATNQYNALFYMNIIDMQINYLGRVENQPKWLGAYPYLTKMENRLFLSPNVAGRSAIYDINSDNFEMIGNEDMKENAKRGRCISYDNSVFYLPIIDNYIAEFNSRTGEWKYHTECIQELSRDVENGIIMSQGMTFTYSVYGEDMWITATYTNRILRFNMKNGTYAVCQIGSREKGYSGIIAAEKYLWLAEVNNGEIIRWERRSGKVKSYYIPEGISTWVGIRNRKLCHLSLIDMDNWIITLPGFSNSMVKLNKVTGEASPLINDFWMMADQKVNGYNPQFHLSCEFGAKLNKNSIIVQRNWDDAVAIVNVEDETYETFYPTLSEEDFEKLIKDEDGFEKIDENSGFYRRESKIFSFEGFIEDLAHDRLTDVRERQLRELSTLATNLDGTCGIKVHEYMMNHIDNNE